MKQALIMIVAVAAAGSTAAAQTEAAPPTDLGQFLGDGVSAVPEGGAATGTTIVIAGVVHGDGSVQVRLEVEIRPITEPLTNVSTHQGPWVAIDTGTSVTISGLSPAVSYHWQATTIPT